MPGRRRPSIKAVTADCPPASRRRKPRLILSDVLKTKQGKACLERLKQSGVRNGGPASSGRRKSDRASEEPRVSRPTRSSQKEAAEEKTKKVLTPDTTPKSSSR